LLVAVRATRSVADGIPTETVGTRGYERVVEFGEGSPFPGPLSKDTGPRRLLLQGWVFGFFFSI